MVLKDFSALSLISAWDKNALNVDFSHITSTVLKEDWSSSYVTKTTHCFCLDFRKIGLQYHICVVVSLLKCVFFSATVDAICKHANVYIF